MIDNFEIGKINEGNYFNGVVEVKEDNYVIKRISKIARKQEIPALYRWNCVYEEVIGEEKKSYEDSDHTLRAFSKDEMKELMEKSGLKFVEHSSNFEERSFVSLGRKE